MGTKGNCGWICSWPCEPCAYLPEVVHARSGHSVGRWVGPRDPLVQVRTSSLAVLFGKHSRPERLRRVLRRPSMVESARGRQILLDGGEGLSPMASGFDFAVSFVPLPSRRLQ